MSSNGFPLPATGIQACASWLNVPMQPGPAKETANGTNLSHERNEKKGHLS